jgi:hypothetical protein
LSHNWRLRDQKGYDVQINIRMFSSKTLIYKDRKLKNIDLIDTGPISSDRNSQSPGLDSSIRPLVSRAYEHILGLISYRKQFSFK